MDKIEINIDTLRAACENSTPVKKVYICGKISGLHVNDVRQKFEQAEKLIIEQGYIPVNPTKNGLPHNKPWEQHMALDIILLMGCDAIYLLADWEDSRGARIEKAIAELLNKELIFEQL